MLSQYSRLACYSTDRFPGRINGTDGIGYKSRYEMGLIDSMPSLNKLTIVTLFKWILTL